MRITWYWEHPFISYLSHLILDQLFFVTTPTCNSTTLPRLSFMGDTTTSETFIIYAIKKGKWRGNLYNHEIGRSFIESEEIANLIRLNQTLDKLPQDHDDT